MSLTIHGHDGGKTLVEGVFGGDYAPQRLVGVRWWGRGGTDEGLGGRFGGFGGDVDCSAGFYVLVG
jgi:hypothetical protein